MEPIAEGAASAIAIALCNKRVLALEGQCRVLAAEVDVMRPVVDAVIGHKRDLGFRFPVQVDAAVDAYEAAKEQGDGETLDRQAES